MVALYAVEGVRTLISNANTCMLPMAKGMMLLGQPEPAVSI